MYRLFAMLVLLLPLNAFAASSTSLTFDVHSPQSKIVACSIAYPTGFLFFTAPVPAGSLIAPCTVTPNGWRGVLTVSGPDTSFFSISGMNLVVGPVDLTDPRTYNVTITATP